MERHLTQTMFPTVRVFPILCNATYPMRSIGSLYRGKLVSQAVPRKKNASPRNNNVLRYFLFSCKFGGFEKVKWRYPIQLQKIFV